MPRWLEPRTGVGTRLIVCATKAMCFIWISLAAPLPPYLPLTTTRLPHINTHATIRPIDSDASSIATTPLSELCCPS